MNQVNPDEFVKAVHQAAIVGGTMIDQTPEVSADKPFAQEWATFKREVYLLVNEGHTGRFAVLKGDRVQSVWDTFHDAEQAGCMQFGGGSFLVQEIQLFLRPMRWGYNRLCPK